MVGNFLLKNSLMGESSRQEFSYYNILYVS